MSSTERERGTEEKFEGGRVVLLWRGIEEPSEKFASRVRDELKNRYVVSSMDLEPDLNSDCNNIAVFVPGGETVIFGQKSEEPFCDFCLRIGKDLRGKVAGRLLIPDRTTTGGHWGVVTIDK